MRLPTAQRGGIDDSFMTPMIDVVFQLLIFFVCASVGQLAESHLPTPLAAGTVESAQAAASPPPLGRVLLKLTRLAGATQAEVNGRVVPDWAGLKTTLRDLAEAAPEIPVILDIQPAVPVGDLVDIYDTCRAAGFQSVQFATDAPRP